MVDRRHRCIGALFRAIGADPDHPRYPAFIPAYTHRGGLAPREASANRGRVGRGWAIAGRSRDHQRGHRQPGYDAQQGCAALCRADCRQSGEPASRRAAALRLPAARKQRWRQRPPHRRAGAARRRALDSGTTKRRRSGRGSRSAPHSLARAEGVCRASPRTNRDHARGPDRHGVHSFPEGRPARSPDPLDGCGRPSSYDRCAGRGRQAPQPLFPVAVHGELRVWSSDLGRAFRTRCALARPVGHSRGAFALHPLCRPGRRFARVRSRSPPPSIPVGTW